MYFILVLVLYNFYGVVYLILSGTVRILFFRCEEGSDGIKRETVIPFEVVASLSLFC